MVFVFLKDLLLMWSGAGNANRFDNGNTYVTIKSLHFLIAITDIGNQSRPTEILLVIGKDCLTFDDC